MKKIRKIGGFDVIDLYASGIPNVTINSKGDIVQVSKVGRGRPKTTKVIMTKQQLEAEKQRYQALSGKELGGVSIKDLSKEERAYLKKYGFTPSVIKRLEFTEAMSRNMSRRGDNHNLTLSRITRTVNPITGEVKIRKGKRPKASSLATGKQAIESRKKFLSGEYYSEKDRQYRENWINALKSGMANSGGSLSQRTSAIILAWLNNGGNVNDLPNLYDIYVGLALAPERGKPRRKMTQVANEILKNNPDMTTEDIAKAIAELNGTSWDNLSDYSKENMMILAEKGTRNVYQDKDTGVWFKTK